MSITSVSDIVRSRTLSALSSTLRAQTQRVQEELATGRRSNIAEFNQGRVGDVQLLEKSINDIGRQREGLALASNRGAVIQISLENISEPITDLSTRVVSAAGLEDQQNLSLLAIEARGIVEQVFSSLNGRANGQYVFSGDAINTPALAPAVEFLNDITQLAQGTSDRNVLEADLETYFDDPEGGFQNNIYIGGSSDAPSLFVGGDERIDFPVRADTQEIRDLLKGLAGIIISGDELSSVQDSALTAQFGSDIRAAQDSITDIRASIGVSEARLETLSIRTNAEEAVLTELFNDRTARDPFEAATELRDLETRLQTSFLVTSRLADLTLTNFLR